MSAKGTVCVTGGTGYLASRLIMQLLDAGYTVHATMRGTGRNVSYLTNLPGASERLKFFSADLDKPESFAPAINGCEGVFHVAHPMEIHGIEPEEVVTHRSVTATLGILRACVDAKTVKRAIHTSSTMAVSLNTKNEESPDEESWTDLDFVRAHLMSVGGVYMVSKTVTEKAAQDFAGKNGLDLVTINPSLINGPFITPDFPASVRASMPMVFGDSIPTIFTSFPIVNVDDVAGAQIHLYEYPSAKGRYICCGFEVTIDELHQYISTKYPELKVPPMDYSEKIIKKTNYNTKKLLDTGFRFKYGFEETFDAAIQICKEKGVF